MATGRRMGTSKVHRSYREKLFHEAPQRQRATDRIDPTRIAEGTDIKCD